MSENVVPFNGVTRLDIDPDRVLEAAIGRCEKVVVIGYTPEGAEYFASSIADGADVVWLLERAKLKLLSVREDEMAASRL